MPKKKSRSRKESSVSRQPENSYHERLPIKTEKFNDLQHVANSCENPAAKIFYRSLISTQKESDTSVEEEVGEQDEAIMFEWLLRLMITDIFFKDLNNISSVI